MLPDANDIEVALFPIPNMVAFPGTVVPLHVFEPRYRQLINDCVDTGRHVGVSHTVKTIHQPARSETIEEALSSNQATYKPREVFSAGACEVVETTDDGRIIAMITMSQRLALIDELQSLPYRIVSCAPVQDEAVAVSEDEVTLQRSINARLVELVEEENPDLASKLREPAWISLEPGDFTFMLFQYLRFDADVMQQILESRSASDRLAMIWELLSRTGRQ